MPVSTMTQEEKERWHWAKEEINLMKVNDILTLSDVDAKRIYNHLRFVKEPSQVFVIKTVKHNGQDVVKVVRLQ